MFVQPHQLRILCVIADGFKIGFFKISSNDPSNVRIPETIDLHRMRISGRVAMAMVMTVMGSPPQRALLRRSLRHERDHKLKPPRGFIRFVGEIAVITASNPKHPHHIQYAAYYPVEQSSPCPDSSQRDQVHNRKSDLLF